MVDQQLSKGSFASFKRWLATRWPRLHRLGFRIRLESRAFRQIGVRGLLRELVERRADWTAALPLQAINSFDLAGFPEFGVHDFREVAARLFGRQEGGGHTVYLSPASWRASRLGTVAERYPQDAGLKVLRNAGSATAARYSFGANHSRLQLSLLHSPRGLSLVANRMFVANVGPRLYDLIELNLGSSTWTAFVVQHLEPLHDPHAAEACVQNLRNLVDSNELGLVLPLGFNHPDFQPPMFGNNVLMRRDGRALYVDFQSFTVPNYGDYLEAVARQAAVDTHFGDRTLFRGGAYLYQKVPTVRRTGKRDPQHRMRVVADLLHRCRLELTGSVVLDIGCNIGMMMGQYLAHGAHWTVGWDRAGVINHAERLLLALGCTRFTLKSRELDAHSAIDEDIPPFLVRSDTPLVISYLAIRGHIGWLSSLADLDWRFMIYESHEEETWDVTRQHIATLGQLAPCEILAHEWYKDGDSRERFIAVIGKKDRR